MLAAALASALLCASLSADPIAIGVQAPPLENVTWLKGEPVTEWAKGHVYLIDFWAPWCAPCIKLMPHNVELANTHKDNLTVVAVAVWPQPESESPEAYVQRAGDDMPFVVAEDVTGHINQTWMDPLRVEGIPHVVLIDKEGRVAWSGHPMNGMDEALTGILDGSYDTNAAAENAKADAELLAKAQPIMQEANALAEAGEWDKALAKVDELIEMGFEPLGMTLTRFQVMLMQLNDAPGAYAFLEKTAFGALNDNAEALSQIAWFLADAPQLPARDLDLAARIATRADALKEGKDPVAIFTLGRIAAAKDLRDEAITRYEQAIALATGEMKAQLQAALEDYRNQSAPVEVQTLPAPAPEPTPEPAPAPAPTPQ